MKLYSYFRSSASWRVRIALAWKGIRHDTTTLHLVCDGGQQNDEAYREINPQRLVPALTIDDGRIIGQSIAIIEYLDEIYPDPPLLPGDVFGRAIVRQMSQAVAADVHPIQNLRVLNYLRSPLGHSDTEVLAWAQHWIALGLGALETLARRHGDGAHCLFGDGVTMADLCLVPQMYNARRFRCDLTSCPALVAIDAHLMTLPAFSVTRPETQPDAT